MAQRTTVTLLDDLDGSVATETVEFALDKVDYTIDLSDAHATALRNALSDYVEAARKVKRDGTVTPIRRRTGGTAPSTADRAENARIREWARRNGFEVSERGRIPAKVTEAYQQRQGVA
jgi:hypothetical protein